MSKTVYTRGQAGAYGIRQVRPDNPDARVCGTCGRAWLEDITPSSRCPWEHLHSLGGLSRKYRRKMAEARL